MALISKGCIAGLNFAIEKEIEANAFHDTAIEKVKKYNDKYEIEKYVSNWDFKANNCFHY